MKSLIHLLVISLCILAYFMYVNPKLVDIDSLRSQLADAQKTLEKSRELGATIERMISSYEAISEEDKAKLNKLLPEEFNNILFVSDVNGIASRNAMVIKSIKVTELDQGVSQETEQVSRPYKTVSSTFSMEGTYEQFIKMLKDMEYSLRLMDVKSLAVNNMKKTPNGYTFEFLLDIDTYYVK